MSDPRNSQDCTKPSDLLERAIDHIHPPKSEEIERTRETIRTIKPALRRGQPLDKTIPRQLRDIFSMLFFCNSLNDIEIFWKPHLIEDERASGLMRPFPPRWVGNPYYIEIYIDPEPLESSKLRDLYTDQFDAFIDVFLHEMAHAFLEKWACRGLCGNEKCKESFEEECGRDGGHGDVWRDLCSIIERCMGEWFEIYIDIKD